MAATTQENEVMPWHVICEPKEGNATGSDRTNQGGLIIYLTNGQEKSEFQRVGYERRHTSYKTTTFKAKLREQMEAAESAATELNRTAERAVELRRRARELEQERSRRVGELDSEIEEARASAESAERQVSGAVPRGSGEPV